MTTRTLSLITAATLALVALSGCSADLPTLPDVPGIDSSSPGAAPFEALEALAEAYRMGTDLGHMFPVKGACYATGKTFIDIKRGADAIPALRTGALRSLETEDLPSMLAAVTMLAAACGQIDELDDAALLYGAIDANGSRHGYSIIGADVRYGELHRERVRAAMTDADWDAAYSRGTELSLQALMRHIMQLG